MSVRDNLVALKQEIEAYRNELYGKYNEMYFTVENKTRMMVAEFSKFVEDPSLEIKYMLGRKVLSPQCVTSDVVETKIHWAGLSYPYGLPRTIRNYDLISVPMFEFDPETDRQKILEAVRNVNTMSIRTYLYARFEHGTFAQPTQEDSLFQYVFCDKVYDGGTLIDDFEIPFAYFFVTLDGNIYTVNKLYAGTKVILFEWSVNPFVFFLAYIGKVMYKNIETNETYEEDGIMILLSNIELYFGAGARWLFGNSEIHGKGMVVRTVGVGSDIVSLCDYDEAVRLREIVRRADLMFNVAAMSLATRGTGISLSHAINKVIKSV